MKSTNDPCTSVDNANDNRQSRTFNETCFAPADHIFSNSSAPFERFPLDSAASNKCSNSKEIDVFRDTPVRLLGYANEIGESFRALVPLTIVRFSYVVASGYVFADTIDKSWKMYKRDWTTPEERNRRVGHAAVDALIWQTLASVVIPGFVINRVCALSLYVLRRTTKLPVTVNKWATAIVGLSCIPFIIKPIDRSVDVIMDVTLRAWFDMDVEQKERDP